VNELHYKEPTQQEDEVHSLSRESNVESLNAVKASLNDGDTL
jgi:hypothetical protein